MDCTHYVKFITSPFMRKIGYLAFALVLVLACSKELDFDMIDDLKVKSSATLPLAALTLSLEDLVSDIEDSTLVVDPNNALRIYYRQDSVFTYSINDILTIPDQDPLPLLVDRSQPTFDLNVALGTIAGAQLYNAVFETGRIAVEINASDTVQAGVRLAFSLKNATLNGVVYSDTFLLPAGTNSVLDTSIINGLDFDFTDGGTSVNALSIGLEIIDTANVSSGNIIVCSVALQNLGVEVATGYFGDRIQAAPPGDFEFNINGIDQFAGGFYLTDPSLTLVTNSTVGLPIQISTDFIGENSERQRISLDNAPFDITASPAPGVVAVSNLTLDGTNSQITNFLANIPQKIYYSGQIQINPAGPPPQSTPNFISNTSNVVLDFEVNVPMEFRLEDMRLDQTVEDLGGGIDNLENLDQLTVFFKSENRLPFDLNLSVSFISALGDSINGFELPLLSAAPVDANGRVTTAVVQESPVVFDQDLIDDFLNMKDMRFVASVNTTNGGQTSVKMYTDYDLKIQVAMQAKGNYQINSNQWES